MMIAAKPVRHLRKADVSFHKESDGFTVADLLDVFLSRMFAAVADHRLSVTAALGIPVLVLIAVKML
jgi:hypothetical protein